MKLRLSILAALLAALIATPGAPAASKATYYLSLGDSLAQGYQPIGGPWSPNAPSGYNHGYTDELFKLTRDSYEQLQEVKLGCGGETTTTLRFGGGFCTLRAGLPARRGGGISRRARRGGRLRHDRHRRERPAHLAGRPGDRGKPPGNRRHAPRRGRAERADRRDELLRPVRRARLVRDAEPRRPPIGGREHRRLQRLPRGHLRHVRRGGGRRRGRVLAHRLTIQPSGLPLNVQRACEWTWMCSVGDIHANSEGYAVIARAFAEELAP